MNDYGYLFATFFAMMIISFGERALPFAAGEWLQKQKWAIVLGSSCRWLLCFCWFFTLRQERH